MKKSLLMMFIAVVAASCAFAGDISVKATVTDNRVAMGEGLRYTIAVSGAKDLTPPELPPIDGFDASYTGPATRVSVINGAYSVEQSFNYVLVPLKEGKFVIPPVTVDVKGEVFTTEAIVVEVAAAPSPEPSQAQAQDIKDRLKLLMALGKEKAFVGEAVPLTLRLYVNELSLQDLSYPEMEQQGFAIDPFPEPRQFEDVLDGMNWHVIEFTTTIYPSQAGALVVRPALVKGALVFKVNETRGTPGGIFDDGFFGNFFSSYQKRPLTITSNSVRLETLPLPEEGKPADFSGALGQYDLAVEAAPLKVKAGDPVTLRMTLSGAGNMKGVKMPVVDAPGFKVYDPQIRDEAGHKILEQVIIPTDVKCTQIPPVKFSYFDTQDGAYKAIERGPFALEVAAPAAGEEFQAVGFAAPVNISSPEKLGRDIVFIKDDPGAFIKKSGAMRRDFLFYILFVVYVQVWAGLLAFYLHRRRMTSDPKFARQVKAAREAFLSLKNAEEALKSGNVKDFYDRLQGALNEYFIRRLDIAPGRTDRNFVEAALRDVRVDAKYIDVIRDIYAEAEGVRFARMPVSEAKMRTHLADAQDLIKAVERRAR